MGTWGEITYDDLTGSIIGKIGTRNYDKSVTGFLNLKTGQMQLMEECGDDDLADLACLEADGWKLKPDWYGFSLASLGEAQIRVSPMSGQFGGIPIKLAPLFEAYVKHLFGGRMRGSVLFYQFHYKRNIPPEKLAAMANFSNILVPESRPDEDLLKAHPLR
jgi:predicted AlkP superfamily pyrophosphatase or phosphodiesterase